MNHRPLEIVSWDNSFNHTPELSERDLCFILINPGIHQIKWNQLVLDGQGSFAFLARGPGDLSFNGNGPARYLSCDYSFITNILRSGYGSRLSAFLSPLATSFLCFRPHGQDWDFINEIIIKLIREQRDNRRDKDQIQEFHLLELLLHLRSLRKLTPLEIRDISSTQLVWSMEEIVRFVKQNYDGSYTLDDLASRCALNSSYFSRAFKEHTGIPLFEYINRLRIEKACQLLKNSDLSILEIALSVGYNNVSFFNRYFKRIHLISPGEYRRRIRS
jgi:AraC-like DNA-binding protein